MTDQNSQAKPPNLDELHDRADWFAKEFSSAKYEMGEAQNFIRGLCEVYGISPYRAVQFEERVKKDGGKGINRIDGLFPGLLLIEMKSDGKNLDDAYLQAIGYIPKLKQTDQPRYVLVSDFQNLHLYDCQTPDTEVLRFKLADFQQHVEALGFLCGYEKLAIERQEKANTEAAEKLAQLHDAIKATGYAGKDLETLLVRILFCLFADDTGLFSELDLFAKLVGNARSDGRDLDSTLGLLFSTLDTKGELRAKNLYDELRPFPYVNGELFKGGIAPCYFDSEVRDALLDCCNINWAQISPDIFGSLFQAIMHHDGETDGKRIKGNPNKRREYGAHYTSEPNIHKVIAPLFLDAFKVELKTIRKDAKKLSAFLAKLRELNFFDPACGCGNFLVVTYREIRLLEEEALDRLHQLTKQNRFPACDVDQFHGIEIDPSAVQIATVALWLTDHQMNCRVNTSGGEPYVRLPLAHRANIVCGNALRLDWNEVIPAKKCSYVMGNPPFVGAKFMSDEQRADARLVFDGIDNSGLLDYVAGWYVKAGRYIQDTTTPVAFVSTNSITQGEQVGALWSWMLKQKINIHFAHRTFRWNNEGRGVAAVHCVIVGFGLSDGKKKVIYDYADIGGEPEAIKAKNINPYLVDAPDVMLSNRQTPLCNVPVIGIGNKPIDGGNYLFTPEEKDEFLKLEPQAAKWFRRWIGADEFINGYERQCLWLGECPEDELRKMPEATKRVAAVRAERLASKSPPTQKLAATPTRFHVENIPDAPYLVIPEVSSERRAFVPIGFMQPDTLSSNLVKVVPNATLYHFGILTSTMHNAWMRTVCGRLKSDYRYSAGIVYNNYPWPTPDEAQQAAITGKAQAILDARTTHEGKSLAWLYNPETMPGNLKQAHAALDGVVDAAYGYKGKKEDAARVAFLFKRYQVLTAPKTIKSSGHVG